MGGGGRAKTIVKPMSFSKSNECYKDRGRGAPKTIVKLNMFNNISECYKDRGQGGAKSIVKQMIPYIIRNAIFSFFTLYSLVSILLSPLDSLICQPSPLSTLHSLCSCLQ